MDYHKIKDVDFANFNFILNFTFILATPAIID